MIFRNTVLQIYSIYYFEHKLPIGKRSCISTASFSVLFIPFCQTCSVPVKIPRIILHVRSIYPDWLISRR